MVASQLRQATTDFAKQLAGLTTIVAVEELRRCAAVGATASSWQGAGTASANRRQRSTMLALILSTQLLPVQGGLGRRRGGLSQRGLGIDVEIAVVGMLLAEVVARLRLGLTPGENLLQLLDKFLQILAGKFPTEPKHQSWYAAHGGESLGNRGGFPGEWFGKERLHRFFYSPSTPTAEAPARSHTGSRLADAPQLTAPLGGESRNAGFSHEFNRIPA
jgi:hypothetical protein